MIELRYTEEIENPVSIKEFIKENEIKKTDEMTAEEVAVELGYTKTVMIPGSMEVEDAEAEDAAKKIKESEGMQFVGGWKMVDSETNKKKIAELEEKVGKEAIETFEMLQELAKLKQELN